MQIKKFIAPTLKEAASLMKAELGDDAIVLSTKVIEGNPRIGLKKMFELTSGMEDDANFAKFRKERSSKLEQSGSNSYDTEVKKLTKKIYGASEKYKDTIIETEALEPPKTGKTNLEKEYDEVRDILLHREVDENITDEVLRQMKKYSAFLNSKNLDNYVISTIGSMITTASFEYSKKKHPMLIGLVGPTGVGKTTCIAKLAVISKILHNLDIGLISIDTYRLGALDQLKIFSEISNVDFLVAYTPADLPKHISKFKKKDIVFIDTAGRSQNNTNLLKGINDFLDPVKLDEIYLVLSTTTTSKNMIDVAEKFKILNYNGIILTKLDEAISFGNILNLSTKYNVPIKYLTNGQIIPDDIIAADSESIANMIYTGRIN